MSLPHTRDAVKKHRGLMVVIIVLVFVAALEPAIHSAGDACLDFLNSFRVGEEP